MKNLISKSALVALLVTLSFYTFAQGFQVQGKVQSEENKEILPGVNVMVKGTTTGTITDFDGNYSLQVKETDVLVFSFLGKTPQEIAVKNQKEINVLLRDDAKMLDDVVVVGYGVQKKSHLTGSVSKLENESLDQLPTSRADLALQGKIAGVSIKAVTSEVGAAPQIRVRGMGSISASNEPLVVVDGYPIVGGLDLVDMNNVASIEVLKDASSAAIYGSRGANGVILITTKSGDATKTTYTFNMFTGVKSAYKLFDILDAYEYTDMNLSERQRAENWKAGNEGREPGTLTYYNRERGMRLVADNSGGSTDWQKESTRETATISKYQLAVSGGSKTVKYYLGGSYNSDQGLMRDNYQDRLDIQAKISANLSPKLEVGFNVKPSYKTTRKSVVSFSEFARNQQWLPTRHNAYTAALTGNAIGSYAHGRHFNNTLFTYTNDLGAETTFTESLWGTSNNNPISNLENEFVYQDEYRVLTNLYAKWDIIKGLTFNTSVGAYVNYRNNHAYRNVYADKTGQNYGENDDRLIVDLLNENTLNYTFDIGKHSFTTLAGFTQQRTNTHTAGVYGTNFPTDYIETLNAATIIDAKQTYTSLEEVALTSYLGRINYAYDNKYMFSVALRTDGSSLFGPQNKWGWFPSVSFGWNVVDENFFASLKDKVNKLKLRLSMGVSGNNDIENYAHVNRLYPSNYSLGAGNGTVTAGVGQTGTVLANPAISWEQSTEYNGGLDLGVLNDRITMSLDYYYSTTNQLLLKQNVAGYTGYEKFWNNVGNVENKGFELEFSTFNIRSKDFSWKSSFNISANSNRLLSLGGESQFISVGERSEQYLAKVGESSIQFYGYKMIGVWQTSAELAANPHSNDDAVGGIRVADTNNDNKIDADDRVTLGSPFPKFNWGFSNNFEYKSFDLSFMFQGSQGAKIFYGDGYYTEMRYLQKELVDGRWFSEGFAATAPREKLGRDWLLTDYLIRDASYVVLRDVLLGYTLPKKISKKIGLSKLRMYCSAQNLLYFMADDYIGINPEAVNTTSNYASPLIDGYQRGAYPLVRTITLGLDIKF